MLKNTDIGSPGKLHMSWWHAWVIPQIAFHWWGSRDITLVICLGSERVSWYQDPGTKILVPSYWFQKLGSGFWYQVTCRVQVLRGTPSQYLSCQKVMCSLVAEICISACPSWPLWWNSTSSMSRSWFNCLTMLSWCFHHITGGHQSDKLQLAICIWYGCPVRFWIMFLSFVTSPTLGVCSELAARKLKPASYPCRKVSAFSVVIRQHIPQTWKFSLH